MVLLNSQWVREKKLKVPFPFWNSHLRRTTKFQSTTWIFFLKYLVLSSLNPCSLLPIFKQQHWENLPLSSWGLWLWVNFYPALLSLSPIVSHLWVLYLYPLDPSLPIYSCNFGTSLMSGALPLALLYRVRFPTQPREQSDVNPISIMTFLHWRIYVQATVEFKCLYHMLPTFKFPILWFINSPPVSRTAPNLTTLQATEPGPLPHQSFYQPFPLWNDPLITHSCAPIQPKSGSYPPALNHGPAHTACFPGTALLWSNSIFLSMMFATQMAPEASFMTCSQFRERGKQILSSHQSSSILDSHQVYLYQNL